MTQAPVALQQERFIAKQIKRLVNGPALESFKYIDKGSIATIGRNKIGTVADWTWNYLAFDRGNRQIMDSV